MAKRLATLLMTAGALLLVVESRAALDQLGRRFPSIMVDPWADYSVVYIPTWREAPSGAVRAGDRLDAISRGCSGGNVECGPQRVLVVRTGNDYPARQLDASAQVAEGAGLTLHFVHDGQPVSWNLTLREFGVSDVWWLFGLYALLGSLFLWAAVLVLRSGVRRGAGLVFALVSFEAFVFLTTFFDYHTGRATSPVFAIASFELVPSVLLLALFFPRPPAMGRFAWSCAIVLLVLLGVAGLVSGGLTQARYDARPLRLFLNALLAPTFAVLGLAMLARLRSRDAFVRREVRTAIWGLMVTPLVICALVLLGTITDAVWLHLLLPLTALIVPASVGVSVLRSDVFATGAIVRPWQVGFPTLVFAMVVGGSAAAALGAEGLTAGVVVCLAAAVTALVTWRLMMRWLFPSAASFRPIVEALAAGLVDLRDEDEVRNRVQASLRSVLPGRRIELLVGAEATVFHDESEVSRRSALKNGNDELGVLRVGQRDDRGLLTQSDLALIDVVCVVASLAFQSLRARRELETQRQLEARAGRTDKRLSVDTLAAEVAHELAYPLSYFRHFLGRLEQVHRVPSTDLEIGRDEVARLERMVSTVRRFQPVSPQVQTLQLRPIIERVEKLLSEDLRALSQSFQLDLPFELHFSGDGDLTVQLFANLVRNASQAAGSGGAIGITTAHEGSGGVRVTVWDSGPGLTFEANASLFKPFFSTRPDGSGLGLSICHRIARSLGWSIEVSRDQARARTCFTIIIGRAIEERSP